MGLAAPDQHQYHTTALPRHTAPSAMYAAAAAAAAAAGMAQKGEEYL